MGLSNSQGPSCQGDAPAAFALLLLLLLPLAFPAHTGAAPGAASEPPLAASFELPTRDGTVASAALRGKVVLIDFWASWCGPCRRSFPWLRAMSVRYGPQGLAVVAIDLDKDRQLAEAFLRDFSTPFTVAFDPAGKTAEAFHVEAMPSSFLVNRDGHLVYSHSGFDDKDTARFEKRIEEAISK